MRAGLVVRPSRCQGTGVRAEESDKEVRQRSQGRGVKAEESEQRSQSRGVRAEESEQRSQIYTTLHSRAKGSEQRRCALSLLLPRLGGVLRRRARRSTEPVELHLQRACLVPIAIPPASQRGGARLKRGARRPVRVREALDPPAGGCVGVWEAGERLGSRVREGGRQVVVLLRVCLLYTSPSPRD